MPPVTGGVHNQLVMYEKPTFVQMKAVGKNYGVGNEVPSAGQFSPSGVIRPHGPTDLHYAPHRLNERPNARPGRAIEQDRILGARASHEARKGLQSVKTYRSFWVHSEKFQP
jgi:hypothetical protein